MKFIERKNDSANRRHFHRTGAALLVVVGLFGAKAAVPATTPAVAAIPAQIPAQSSAKLAPAQKHHWYQVGFASWYGQLFQGKPTASGESFDMNQLTCAHRSLPLGSLIRVTNLRNHKSVVVRVNDRGPVPENRVVDLSYAAAHFLGMSHAGTARVKLELIQSNGQLAQLSFPMHPGE
jgi:rare lipoprotein A